VDRIQELIALAEDAFASGEAALVDGRLEEAQASFDRALDLLLEPQPELMADERLREAFVRLVDRMSVAQLQASGGDGHEAAALGELLAASAFDGPEAPTPPEFTRVIRNDLASTAHDIPIPLHSRVVAYVRLFTGRLRDWMQASLDRGSRYIPMIHQVFRAEGLPLDLAYVPVVESAFRPGAVSRAKATGVWQFMMRTALENGLRYDWYVDERADPEKATLAAARYLRALYDRFNGDWHLALASYNAGPGRVERALRRSGRSDFWAISASSAFLPKETREYVPMILAAIIVARNPVQYGFEVRTPFGPLYERVALPGATDLRRLAEGTGLVAADLKDLNPELRRWTTPVGPGYELKVPHGAAERVRQHLLATPVEAPAVTWHVIQRGDTLSALARRYGISTADLAAANQLTLRSRLRLGQELVVPPSPGRERALPPAEVQLAANGSATQSRSGSTTYVVRRGDTLYGIARRFGLSVESLKSLNRLTINRIFPGDRLQVSSPRTDAQ
jgi:membrane-bound lytic murein transglycosylase D